MSRTANHPNPDTVTDRLVSLAKDIDRQLAQLLEANNCSRRAFELLADAGREIPGARQAELAEALEGRLPAPDPRFRRVTQPDPRDFNSNLRMLRI